MAELHLTLGPMFAGKSTELIKLINFILQNKFCNNNEIAIINHRIDNRDSDESNICTHNNVKMPCLKIHNLADIFTNSNININTIKYIFIDEGQFFPDLYETVKTLLLKYNKTIYISCLDGDYQQKPFYESRLFDLIPYATSVTKLTARCADCNNTAPFTKRLINSGEQILVGGSDSYKPVCLNHL